MRARAPGALILFLLRSSPSHDVNDLQLDISRRSSRPPAGRTPRGRRSRKRSTIFAGNLRDHPFPLCIPLLFPLYAANMHAITFECDHNHVTTHDYVRASALRMPDK